MTCAPSAATPRQRRRSDFSSPHSPQHFLATRKFRATFLPSPLPPSLPRPRPPSPSCLPFASPALSLRCDGRVREARRRSGHRQRGAQAGHWHKARQNCLQARIDPPHPPQKLYVRPGERGCPGIFPAPAALAQMPLEMRWGTSRERERRGAISFSFSFATSRAPGNADSRPAPLTPMHCGTRYTAAPTARWSWCPGPT